MSLTEKLSSRINEIQLNLRERVTGKIVMRSRLPLPTYDEQTDAEQNFYRLLLARALDAPTNAADVVWDIGCRNWSYAPALADVFPQARLIGVEVDGRRRYWNLYRRMDYATAQASSLSLDGRDSQCVFADFRNVPVEFALNAGETSMFCFFFPFVSPNPCLKWGLPLHFANFENLLRHARTGAIRAKSDAEFVSCHQGEWEAEIAKEAYENLGLAVKHSVVNAREYEGLWPSSHDVHVLTSVTRGTETTLP